MVLQIRKTCEVGSCIGFQWTDEIIMFILCYQWHRVYSNYQSNLGVERENLHATVNAIMPRSHNNRLKS